MWRMQWTVRDRAEVKLVLITGNWKLYFSGHNCAGSGGTVSINSPICVGMQGINGKTLSRNWIINMSNGMLSHRPPLHRSYRDLDWTGYRNIYKYKHSEDNILGRPNATINCDQVDYLPAGLKGQTLRLWNIYRGDPSCSFWLEK